MRNSPLSRSAPPPSNSRVTPSSALFRRGGPIRLASERVLRDRRISFRYTPKSMTTRVPDPRRRRWVVLSIRAFLPLFCLLSCASQQPDANLQNSLRGLSLEELGNIEVTSVSNSPVTVTKTPDAVYVLSHLPKTS